MDFYIKNIVLLIIQVSVGELDRVTWFVWTFVQNNFAIADVGKVLYRIYCDKVQDKALFNIKKYCVFE